MIILKSFARKDYENLSEYKKSILKEKRSNLAKDLIGKRAKVKKLLNDLDNKVEYLNQEDLKKYISGDRRSLEDINKIDLDRKSKVSSVRDSEYNKLLKTLRNKKDNIKKSVESLEDKVSSKSKQPIINKKASKFLNKKLLKYGGGGLLSAGIGLGAAKLYKNHKENTKKNSIKKQLSGK